MGRPSKRTERAAAVILSRIAEGEGLAAALEAAGLCRAAFFRWQADEPSFGQAVESARASAAVGKLWRPLALRLQERAASEAERAKARAARQDAIERAYAGDFSGFTDARDRALWRSVWLALREPAPGFELVRRVGADGIERWHVWKVRKGRPVRCGARTRAGGLCQAQALLGRSRCRGHGGLSTGPKKPSGSDR